MAICGERRPERIWIGWEQVRSGVGNWALVAGNPYLFEIEWLCRIARSAPNAFEIGTFTGITTLELARAALGTVWTLDLPEGMQTRWELSDYDRGFLGRGKVKFPPNVVQLWGDSATFDFGPYRGRCGLVFVDGAHSVEYSRNDLKAALGMRVLRQAQEATEGGVVIWHVDDLGREPGPGPIADEFDFVRLAGSRLWLVGEVGELQSSVGV